MRRTFPTKEESMSRRDFVRGLSLMGTALGVSSLLPCAPGGFGMREAEGQAEEQIKTKAVDVDLNAPYVHATPAKLYKVEEDKAIRCQICARNCHLPNNKTCFCRTHINRDGKLYTTAWANPCVLQPDPIEQGPLYHMALRDDVRAMYVATGGCMLRCQYCQNYEISQEAPMDVTMLGTDWEPKKVIEYTLKAHETIPSLKGIPVNCMAYSYTDPVAYYEYFLAIAQEAKKVKKRKLINIMVTSAYIRPDALKATLPYVDAYIFTFKGWTEEFYTKICSATPGPVMEAMKIVKEAEKWLEVPILIVPSFNDREEDVKSMIKWVLENLGENTPIHFAALTPKWKMSNVPRTPPPFLEQCRNWGLEAGLKFVYLLNVPGHDGNNTWCPKCGSCVVRRIGVKCMNVMVDKGGRCMKCKYKLPGIWNANV
ncbi:MAG: AmmeMemoRadiSam system radical SAM enzyme [Planctomycetota bacterium]